MFVILKRNVWGGPTLLANQWVYEDKGEAGADRLEMERDAEDGVRYTVHQIDDEPEEN